jgi:hypothetical protein
MRIWMLASLLFAVTAIGGDRGIETSSRFFDRAIATSPRSNPQDCRLLGSQGASA